MRGQEYAVRPTSLCSKHLFSMLVGLELGICIEEVSGSDEWLISRYEE